MGEDKSDKIRPVLGDLTNQLGKRGFSLISRSPNATSKSGNGSKRTIESNDKENDCFSRKQVSLENIEKERFNRAKFPKVSSEVGLFPLKGGKVYRLHTPSNDTSCLHGNASIGSIKGPSSSVLDTIDLTQEQAFPNVVIGKRFQAHETRALSDGGENYRTQEALVTQVARDGGKSRSVDCLTSTKSGLVLDSRLRESQNLNSFGLERCTGLKGDGLDLLKSCSCSFCTKAAYIWSDLHYQDVKGRISILMKSQKEASDLAQRYAGESEIGRHGEGNSNKVTHLETDLMTQWKSLFLHMENVFVTENTQLQTDFLALKDLREDFKMNLEMSSDVQQCSSDASDRTIL